MKKTQILNAFLATLTACALMLAALPAAAGGQSCGPRGKVVERLSTQFGETRRGIGLNNGNRVLEIWASDATGSWTVTVSLPSGRTCLLATGQAWEDRMDDLAHLADIES
jgi:hypothetical protein